MRKKGAMIKLKGPNISSGKPKDESREGKTIARVNGINIKKNKPAGIYVMIFCFVVYSFLVHSIRHKVSLKDNKSFLPSTII